MLSQLIEHFRTPSSVETVPQDWSVFDQWQDVLRIFGADFTREVQHLIHPILASGASVVTVGVLVQHKPSGYSEWVLTVLNGLTVIAVENPYGEPARVYGSLNKGWCIDGRPARFWTSLDFENGRATLVVEA